MSSVCLYKAAVLMEKPSLVCRKRVHVEKFISRKIILCQPFFVVVVVASTVRAHSYILVRAHHIFLLPLMV